MPVIRVAIQRILVGIAVLAGLSVVIFVLVRIIPGDPARVVLGPMATDEQIAALREQLHLNEDLVTQYAHFLTNALTGDFGQSLVTKRSVTTDVLSFLPATLELVLFAALFMIVIGLALGIVSAKFRNGLIDHIIRFVALFGVMTPSFVWAIMLMLIFGFVLGWFPISGRLADPLDAPPMRTGLLTVDSLLAGDLAGFRDALFHLFMPALALSMAGLGQTIRLTRASMLDSYAQQYVEMMRSFGVSEFRIATKYAFRPAFIPVLTVLGLDLAALFGYAFLVEIVFVWPGIARYGIQAMLQNDLNAVTAVVMIIGVLFVFINIAVDIASMYINPRMRVGAGS